MSQNVRICLVDRLWREISSLYVPVQDVFERLPPYFADTAFLAISKYNQIGLRILAEAVEKVSIERGFGYPCG